MNKNTDLEKRIGYPTTNYNNTIHFNILRGLLVLLSLTAEQCDSGL